MPVRSALQKQKAREVEAVSAQMSALARQTRVAEAKAESEQVDAKIIGRRLHEAYRSEAVRGPETFKRPLKTRNTSQIRLAYALHMFGDYPVTPMIQNAFLASQEVPEAIRNLRGDVNREQATEILLAEMIFFAIRKGDSVFKKATREFLTKKETHVLTTCRYDLTLKQAFIYVLALNDCAPGHALRIAKSPRMVDVYRYGDEFWREVIRFFARNEAVTREQITNIVDYLRVKHIENANWSIKGRTVEKLVRAHEEWVREMARAKVLGNHVWDGLHYPDLDFTTRNDKHGWRMFQIKSSKELGREGSAMRHCVLSYRPMCSDGKIGIYTLRHCENMRGNAYPEYDKCLTIEVSAGGTIRQVRGFANRLAAPFEDEAVAFWAAQNGITYNRRDTW